MVDWGSKGREFKSLYPDHFYFNFLIFRNLLIVSVFRRLLRFGTQSVPQGAENGCFRQKPCVPKR